MTSLLVRNSYIHGFQISVWSCSSGKSFLLGKTQMMSLLGRTTSLVTIFLCPGGERSTAKADDNTTFSCHPLAEAMVDRCLFEESQSSERALAGSKWIFFKYRRCRNLYMEIIQKLVAVSLVSVVGSDAGLHWSLAITLLTAAVSAMVQPFLQPQVRGKTWDWWQISVANTCQQYHRVFTKMCIGIGEPANT